MGESLVLEGGRGEREEGKESGGERGEVEGVREREEGMEREGREREEVKYVRIS